MKFLTTLIILLFVSLSSAQEVKKENTANLNNNSAKTTTVDSANAVVISVRGIKTLEEIDIENYNKASYLKLIASKKQKPKMC